MTKVYILTSGSYSSYRVEGIFDSKEKAEEYQKYFTGPEYNEIEEDEVNPEQETMRAGDHCYTVRMEQNGNSVVDETLPPWDMEHLGFSVHKQYCIDGKPTDARYLFGRVIAKSKEHAVKIANEKRVQLIASGEL